MQGWRISILFGDQFFYCLIVHPNFNGHGFLFLIPPVLMRARWASATPSVQITRKKSLEKEVLP